MPWEVLKGYAVEVERNDLMFRFMNFALLITSEAKAGWFSYDSYDDCMLGKMKGQDRSMYPSADKECKRLFGVEFDVWASNVEWSFASGETGTRIRIDKAPTDYKITKGEFIFADKTCEGSKDTDFGRPTTIEFKNAEAPSPRAYGPRCAKALSFRGKYK